MGSFCFGWTAEKCTLGRSRSRPSICSGAGLLRFNLFNLFSIQPRKAFPSGEIVPKPVDPTDASRVAKL